METSEIDQVTVCLDTQRILEKQISKLKADFHLLYAALDTLTPRERDIVITTCNNEVLSQLTNRNTNELLESAIDKLGSFT